MPPFKSPANTALEEVVVMARELEIASCPWCDRNPPLVIEILRPEGLVPSAG
jgi:hypothetical protein